MKRAALAAFGLALTVVVGVVAVAPSASAHAELLTSSPADGDTLAAAPATVDLTFSEDLLPETVAVAVEPEGGDALPADDVTVDGPVVTIGWPAAVTAGTVAVNYRVVSADGHPISGSVRFTIAASAEATAAPADSTSTAPSAADVSVDDAAGEPAAARSGIPPLAAISLGLAAGIAIGFAFYLRRRRSS